MILGEIGTMLQLRTCAVPIVSCLPFTTITFCGSHASAGDLYNNYLLSRANGYLLRTWLVISYVKCISLPLK